MKYSSLYSSPIPLEALLKRRKTTLEAWLRESGITNYAALVDRCSRMGVVPPSRAALERIFPPATVSDPSQGLIVIEPPEIQEQPSTAPQAEETPPPAVEKKKRRGPKTEQTSGG